MNERIAFLQVIIKFKCRKKGLYMKVRLISFHSSETFKIFYFYSKTIFTSIPKQLIKFRSNLLHIIKFIQIKDHDLSIGDNFKKMLKLFGIYLGSIFTVI